MTLQNMVQASLWYMQNFKKAFEEAELFTYKTLMLAMSTMDIEEEIERILKITKPIM